MNAAVTKMPSTAAIERVLVQGDLSGLDEAQRINYNHAVCSSLGLNPLTRPFEFIRLNGKLVLYARRDATDQLRKVHGISIQITSREKQDDLYIVATKARNAAGREDESVGCVSIAGLKGEALANAIMKCETKAKRRVTLSICGLGMLDETEVETIPGAERPRDVTPPVETPAEIDHEMAGMGDYVMGYGKFKGQALRDIGTNELAGYLSFLENGAKSAKKPISDIVAESMRAISQYLKDVRDE